AGVPRGDLWRAAKGGETHTPQQRRQPTASVRRLAEQKTPIGTAQRLASGRTMRGNRADPVVVMPIRLRDGRHQAVDALDHGVRLRAHGADTGWNILRVEYQRRCYIFS